MDIFLIVWIAFHGSNVSATVEQEVARFHDSAACNSYVQSKVVAMSKKHSLPKGYTLNGICTRAGKGT